MVSGTVPSAAPPITTVGLPSWHRLGPPACNLTAFCFQTRPTCSLGKPSSSYWWRLRHPTQPGLPRMVTRRGALQTRVTRRCQGQLLNPLTGVPCEWGRQVVMATRGELVSSPPLPSPIQPSIKYREVAAVGSGAYAGGRKPWHTGWEAGPVPRNPVPGGRPVSLGSH